MPTNKRLIFVSLVAGMLPLLGLMRPEMEQASHLVRDADIIQLAQARRTDVNRTEGPHVGVDSGGTPYNQDYFVADRRPGSLLEIMERVHFNNDVFENFRAGRYEYAIPDVDFVLFRYPNHPRALQIMSAIAILRKQPSYAIDYYETALFLYPQYAITHAQFGNYLVKIGVMDDGIARLKKAIELDPKLTAAYVWLAEAYYKKGDRKLGTEAAEQARKLGHKGVITGETG